MSNSTIHLGFWVNHDYSPVIGATLTTSIRWGNYLIAALSTLVSWSGVSAYSIISFYPHRRYASFPDKSLPDQQLQVLLRSPASMYDTLIDTIKLQRAWKGRSTKLKRRTIPLAIITGILICIFAAAGVLVAEVASKSYQQISVLTEPLDCGDFMPTGIDEPLGVNTSDLSHDYQARIDYLMLSAKKAREYTSLVYNGSSDQYHSTFKQERLPLKGKYVDCPWAVETKCLGRNGTEGPAYNMNTGHLGSHVHFGINAPAQNRVTYRKSVTCGVLDVSNFTLPPWTEVVNIGGASLNKSYIGYRLPTGRETAETTSYAINITKVVDSDATYSVRYV